jgi:hypothetical protein
MDKDFEKWWQDHGQYCRSGGGSYEKTFAYRAWEAATKRATTKHAPKPRELSAVGTGALLSEQQHCFDKGWREGIAAFRKMLRSNVGAVPREPTFGE